MKLVIIYGPPAVGKLTVAKELAKSTNYKIFHNHLSMDIISPFLEFGSKIFWKEHRKIRNLIFQIISRNKINSIFTFAYTGKEDDKTIEGISKEIKKNGGKIYFAKLISSEKELKKRVITDSRKKYGKLTDIKGLEKQYKKYNFFQKVSFKPHFEIDNSKISAKKTAELIKNKFKL